MQEVERYNSLLKTAEAKTIRLLEYTLDKSFNRLVRRIRQHLKYPERRGVIDRNLLVLQDLSSLIPAVNPNQVDGYDRIFNNLLQTSSSYGIDVARLTTKEFRERAISASVPLEAVLAAAKQAHGYLRKHGETFAQTSAVVVGQGLAEGRPTESIVRDMQMRLNVTKARARVIVRTESIRAYGEATNQYYAQMGLDYVSWYATSDDRVCPYCSPRAGLIYERSAVKVPLHPQCRCFLAPYDPELAERDEQHRNGPINHRNEVAEETGVKKLPDPSILNKVPAGFFEQRIPLPVQPNQI